MLIQGNESDASDRSFPVTSLRQNTNRGGMVVLARRARRRDRSRWTALQAFLGGADRRGPVILIEGFGPTGWAGWFWRSVDQRATLLMYLSEPPRKELGWAARRLLHRVDGVVVDGHAAGFAAARLGCSAHRIGVDAPLDRFAALEPARLPPRRRRVVVVGALTPASGAYDLLLGLAAWAAAHPPCRIEIVWVGTGQLSPVLAAQPDADNVAQTFLEASGEEQVATVLEGGGILAVPCLADDGRGHVAEALAAGLPVLGSRRNGEVRRHVTDEVTGWVFDPLRPGEMADAIGRAMDADGDRLAAMGVRARDAMTVPGGAVVCSPWLDRRRSAAMSQAVRSAS